jgi:hypothetical protein
MYGPVCADSARRNASFCLILNQQNDILRWIPYTRLTSLFCKAGAAGTDCGGLFIRWPAFIDRRHVGRITMDKMPRRAFGAAGFVLLLATSATFAQQESPTVRVRGTIERIDGSTYVVKTRDGAELRVALADNPQIAGVVKASLSDIKQGSFVGVTAMPQADGSQRALEVHIFPEAMRGTGEGHYPWISGPRAP